MKNITHFFFLIGLAITVSSCQEEVDIPIPATDKKVVIEAEITNEKDSSYVKITQTADYYSTDPYPVINDASVTVNGIVFTNIGKGIYKPASGYVGVVGQTYSLNISHAGKTYAAQTIMEPMFVVDSVKPLFKEAEGFLEAGYTVVYYATDNRPQTKYTYFRFGKTSLVTQSDSLFNNKILFDNASIQTGVYSFELPFLRLQKGDTCLQIFRSVDKKMYDFLRAYNSQTSGAPGPFQVPPANLPTNISGGAIGYFTAYDIVRTRTPIN